MEPVFTKTETPAFISDIFPLFGSSSSVHLYHHTTGEMLFGFIKCSALTDSLTLDFVILCAFNATVDSTDPEGHHMGTWSSLGIIEAVDDRRTH